MLAREEGDWEKITLHAKRLNLSLPHGNRAYKEATALAREMTAAAPAPAPY